MSLHPTRRVTLDYARRHLRALVALVQDGELVFIESRGGGRPCGAVLSAAVVPSPELDALPPPDEPIPTITLQELRKRLLARNSSNSEGST